MGRNAVILVDKGEGVTSFDCLGRIKRNVNKKTGHCGTLDKFAHGLMIVLSGSYTHLVPVFMGMDKTYEAVIEFGKMTDTLDPEGEIVETAPIPSEETVRKAVAKLTGTMIQVPPVYSAIHVNGKRSYEMARSGAENVELKGREIKVFSADVISWESPFLTVRLHVSKGTYVRAWARDLGHECSSCAYVKSLYRTEIGPFSISEAVRYDDVDALKSIPDGEVYLKRLPGCTEMETGDKEAFRVRNGYVPESVRNRIPTNASFVLMKAGGVLFSVYSVKEGRILCQVANGD